MMIRVLLADDQPLVRSGLAMLLNAEPDIEVVGEADDGDQAITLVRQVQPDVIVMDVRMPGTDGVEATRRITADEMSADAGNPVKVLILTTYDLDEAVLGALRAGASGFVLKDAAPAELGTAVRAVAAGDGWLASSVTGRLLKEFAARPDPVARSPEELHRLTAREREVLVQVAHGLSNNDIASGLVISEATVKTHLARVLTKLGLRDRAQAVALAYQSGLVKPGTP
ncbi:DNA-binding NarL/FixJ family response regulator [Streptomyces umbrinus]|uniref:DNA-binding NarL/FixJ family response regulator n=1 Tax=Streptomyces umbrinus TaxID=67370 RepID=A0ABU0TCH2_9ACTN|nr:response regulator transcription factor [Streptomyces umbrinus]MDQ1033342.1 DNA-binding NarL/FixJ family response regulator [Streptomyces umbrinus]